MNCAARKGRAWGRSLGGLERGVHGLSGRAPRGPRNGQTRFHLDLADLSLVHVQPPV